MTWHWSEKWKDRSRYTGWALLAGYILFLMGRALYQNRSGLAQPPLWEFQDAHRLLRWLGELVLMVLGEWACFVPLGLVATLVVPRDLRRPRRFALPAAGLLLAAAVAALVHTVKIGGSWNLAASVGLMIPLLGCLFGAWLGTTWRRGRRARLWFVPKAALVACLIALGAGALGWLSLEDRPLPFDAAPVTSAEKRRLVHLVRSKSPRSLQEGQTTTLELTEHDINVLLSWGLSLGSAQRKATVQLAHDTASFSASIGVPLGRGALRYLNLTLVGGAGVQKGDLRLHADRCRLGSLELPHWLLRSLEPLVTSFLCQDPRPKPFVEATQEMAIEPNSIKVTFGPLHLPPGFRKDLFGPTITSPEMVAAMRAYVTNLLDTVGAATASPPSFDRCFETTFALARRRSVERDPVSENQAAIFALGVLLGHPRLERFLGPVLEDSDPVAPRHVLRRVPVRGRTDWTKHFCVSAALALLSNMMVSDAAGLLKEELDADVGGSGFSFSDLLADRAGTTFALVATRDEAAARAVQDRLAGGFRVDDFFPPAADLPEGIPDAELQSRYGGVGGALYRQLAEEIERRIAACAAYR